MKPKIILFLIAAIISSCNRYYMPVKSTVSTADAIRSAKAEGRYFILRDSMFTYSMKDVMLNSDNETVLCILESVPREHQTYILAKGRNYHFNKATGKENILKEVHLFSNQLIATAGNSQAVIPLSAINRVEEINYDERRTRRQHRTVWLATAGTIILAGLGLAAAAGSAMASGF
jgi:hypothetical protein